eukprot:33966-Eustigmatos_ZCMA.PRE.1
MRTQAKWQTGGWARTHTPRRHRHNEQSYTHTHTRTYTPFVWLYVSVPVTCWRGLCCVSLCGCRWQDCVAFSAPHAVLQETVALAVVPVP